MTDETKAQRVTQAELARYLNVSRASVSKAVKSGRITPGPDDRFDLELATAQWRNNTRATMKAETAKAEGQAPPTPGGQPKYAAARARKELALARIAELKEARLRGVLCRVDDVAAVGAEIGASLRAVCEQFPDRVSGSLVGRTQEQVWTTLNDELESLLADFMSALERKLAKAFAPPPSTDSEAG